MLGDASRSIRVQALVVHPMRRPISRHLLFRFDATEATDAGGAARAFVGELAPQVGMADVDPSTTTGPVLAVGITFSGLQALGVPPDLLARFDAVFKTGPQPAPLGDVPGSRSDPAGWWERRFPTRDVHGIVHAYAHSDAELDRLTAGVRAMAARNGLTELVPRADGTVLDGRSLGDSRVHFGYRDGISQPDVAWDDGARQPGQLDFRRIVLGYATPEHGSAPRVGPAADLVRDSAYGMFRWIYQDVALFQRFLATAGPRTFPDLPPADATELLAAKIVGRWRNGSPLVLAPDAPDPGSSTGNDFGYHDPDPAGQRCPFAAHIRVTNPRDQPLDPVVVDGVPRVLRRGVPYGPPLTGPDDDGVDRGLLGLFLCADLRRHVYTLFAWINRNDFSPVFGASRRTQDPLAGNRAILGTTPVFRIPGEPRERTVEGLPDFLTTKGTAFFLYPGRATLASLAAGSREPGRRFAARALSAQSPVAGSGRTGHGANAFRTPAQHRRQLGVMSHQHRAHVVLGDPAHALGRVGLRGEVGGEEAVALQPPRCHQDEDAERGVAEAEAGRRRLGVQPHGQVDVLDGVVDRGQFGGRQMRSG